VILPGNQSTFGIPYYAQLYTARLAVEATTTSSSATRQGGKAAEWWLGARVMLWAAEVLAQSPLLWSFQNPCKGTLEVT
jgi:hypothetical protein